MNAHLESNFKKGFFLTEEALIKLDDIIRKRLRAVDAEASLKFKVFRADGMLVEFDNPSAVAAEENSNRNAIRRVEILSSGMFYELSLTFDYKDNTDLAIEANDRDLAYLLASDIKDYISSEVLRFRSFSFDDALSSRIVFPLLMLPFLLISISAMDSPSPEAVSSVLASNDVHEKLDFIINNRANQRVEPTRWYLIAMLVILGVLFFLGSFLDKVYPRNIFYWGKLAHAHDRVLSLREKIVWGVVIAFVIGIASAVAVEYFKAS